MGNDAKRFQMTRARRVLNAVITGLINYGVGPSEIHLLTTRGRKSGFLRTTPVSLVDNRQGRFLVAPYGPVDWVHNIRGDGFGTLRRGGWIELVTVEELAPERAALVLKEYLDHPRAAVVGPYFAVAPDAAVDAFVAEAGKHPVFQIVRSQTIRV